MNNRTKGMFADKTHWPGLVESGNIEADPGFGPSINKVFDNNTGNGVGIFQYFTNIRTNTASTDIYGYQPQSISGNNWIPQWPLPEITDMQYSNAVLKTGGTDGKPIGDPGWFTGGYTGVQKTGVQAPDKFNLYDAYPNPFNPSTNIKFNLAKSGYVTLNVYNVLGQLVKSVVNNVYQNKGTHEVNLNMDRFSSGIYFYSLSAGNQFMTKKMILMK